MNPPHAPRIDWMGGGSISIGPESVLAPEQEIVVAASTKGTHGVEVHSHSTGNWSEWPGQVVPGMTVTWSFRPAQFDIGFGVSAPR